jgi:subtilisin family serine protease
VRIVAAFETVVTCRLRREDIRAVRADARIVSMKAPDPLIAERVLDETVVSDGEVAVAVAELRNIESLDVDGKGVVLGVVDWGFDFAHPNFRNEDGTTRLLALWDQRDPTDHPPEPYGYGRLLTRADLNRALADESPYAAAGYHPGDADPSRNGAHGTHVLDIAAGNGRSGGPVGVAPKVEAVCVHLGQRKEHQAESLADSVSLLEAIDFCVRTAESASGSDPLLVLSLSMGNLAGSHDGTSPVERALDELVSAKPGRAVCQSAGNYYGRREHTALRLTTGEVADFVWETDPGDVTPNELEIWYPGSDRLAVQAQAPGGEVSAWVAPDDRDSVEVDGMEACRIYHRTQEPNNGDSSCHLFVPSEAPAGRWTIRLAGERILDGRVHAWIERDESCHGCQSRFDAEHAVRSSTTGTICNGHLTIAVGAYDAARPAAGPARFSSAGPTRDGRPKPDICAPGVSVLAARSAPRDSTAPVPASTRKSGTSMAAPHVAGAIALAFEAAGRPLAIQETRTVLLETAAESSMSPDSAARSGHGYLDIEATVEAARKLRAGALARDEGASIFDGGDATMYGGAEVFEDQILALDTEFLAEGSGPLGQYAVVLGGRENAVAARDGLLWIAQTFDGRRDLKWAFPYVYAKVTDGVIDAYDQRRFANGDCMLEWVVNFYELYVLNLRHWFEKGVAERPWATAFLGADQLASDPRPWGARSAASFILGMFAHIRSDLPRAIAYVFIKLYRNGQKPGTTRDWSVDDFKSDFDLLNTAVFPKVIERIGTEGIVLPGVVNVWPAVRDWYMERRLPLAQERESAWTTARRYVADPAVVSFTIGLPMRRKPTLLSALPPAPPAKPLEEDALEFGEPEEPSGVVLPLPGSLPGRRPAEVLFDAARVESRPGSFHPFDDESLLSPAAVFDAYASPASSLLREHLGAFFDVVGEPGEVLSAEPLPGDVLVRRALGEGRLAHVAVVATRGTYGRSELAMAGTELAEADHGGPFVRLVENQDVVGRRIATPGGRLPRDQLLLRPRVVEVPEQDPPAVAEPRFASAAEIDAFFQRRTGSGFLDWFHATQANRGDWGGKKARDVLRDEETRRRFVEVWNGIPQMFETPTIRLEQFVALQSIFINELGGGMAPIAEKTLGIHGHPGIAYLFDRIPETQKRSYNEAPNKTAHACFNDATFIAAHGALPFSDQLARTSNSAWAGQAYPSGYPVEFRRAGFIGEADFCKFRGRGLIQTTWRSAYREIVRFVQAYDGSNAKVNEYKARWANRDPDAVCTASSNADWDDLFQNTSYVIPWAGIRLHNNHRYLDIATDRGTQLGRARGSFAFMGTAIGGSHAYGQLLARRCIQILDALRATSRPAEDAPVQAQPFKLDAFRMSTKEVEIVRPRPQTTSKRGVVRGRVSIAESPAYFTAEILRLAFGQSFDPATWYSSFTTVPFLGFTVKDVHKELAAHLKSVEQHLIERYGGDRKDPTVAGRALGLKQNIGGGRDTPTGTAFSMHLFGLAIDVNYDTNPWVGDSPAELETVNGVFARAGVLTSGNPTKFETKSKANYEEIERLNQTVKTYFSYLDDRGALEARLKDAKAPWAGKTADAAISMINKDLKILSIAFERPANVVKVGGFLDIPKSFIDGVGLDWGGAYGDMMHFDMRNVGVGRKIESARTQYRKKKDSEAEDRYAATH